MRCWLPSAEVIQHQDAGSAENNAFNCKPLPLRQRSKHCTARCVSSGYGASGYHHSTHTVHSRREHVMQPDTRRAGEGVDEERLEQSGGVTERQGGATD